MSWDELRKEVETGIVAGVPDGTYVVRVDGVRVNKRIESRLLWLDLLIEAGPFTGKVIQPSLYVPEAGNQNAGFHFRNKVAGFQLTDTWSKMEAIDPDGSNVAGALEALADGLVGQRVFAEVKQVTEGDYAGKNELTSTKPLDGSAIAATLTVTPETVATLESVNAPAPQPQGSPVGSVDDPEF